MSKMITLAIDRRRNDSVVDQIKQNIKERMLDKTFVQDEILPEPPLLANVNQLAEEDILTAYQALVKEGYLKEKNDGYHVARFNIEERSILSIQSVREMLQNEGFEPRSEQLEVAIVDSYHHPILKEHYDLSHALLYLKHVYYGDDRPLLYLESYISTKDFPNLTLEKAKESIYNFIKKDIVKAKRSIDVVKATPDIAKALKLESTDALMRVLNLYYDGYGKLLNLSFIYASPNYSLRIDSN